MASKEMLKQIQEAELLMQTADTFVVFDIETSGLHPSKGGRIIEIGAVKIKNGVIVDRFEQLVHPEAKIYDKTTELTGITNEMLIGKPVYREVVPKFAKFIEGSVIVAHNSNFDWNRFMLFFFKNVGIVPNNQVIDSLKLARYYYPELKSHKLGDLCTHFGIKLENAHRAVDDAVATAALFLRIKSEKVESSEEHGFEIMSLIPKEEPDRSSLKAPEASKFIIKRISHWEKQVSKKVRYERIYVTLDIGNVYFDIPTRTWGVQQSEVPIDLRAVSEKAVSELKEKANKHAQAIQSIKRTTIEIDDMLMPRC